MANKSAAQRIVELIAVLAVAGFAVVVVISLRSAGRQEPEVNPLELPKPPLTTPLRQAVENYPSIADVTLNPRPKTTTPSVAMDAADPGELEGVVVRHINAQTMNEIALSPDGQTAIVTEATPTGSRRLAVWNLGANKLIRFLSTEVNRSTQPYSGKENAEYGAKVDGTAYGVRRAFSPSGQQFAMEQHNGSSAVGKILIWEVATGKLLAQSQDFIDSQSPLVFANEDYVVLDAKISGNDAALVRVHIANGESDLLRPIGSANGTSGYQQMVANKSGLLTYVAYAGLHTIDVNTRVHTQAPQASQFQRPLYLTAWLGPDEAEFIACTRNCLIDKWDLTLHERVSSRTFIPALHDVQQAWAAPAAGLVGLRGKDSDVHVYSTATRRRVSLIRIPFRQGRLQAFSSDARRLVVGTDQKTLLIVDFPSAMPTGLIDLADLLVKHKGLSATR